MAKKDKLMNTDYTLDITDEEDPVSEDKLPGSILGSGEALTGYVALPVTDIIEYQSKSGSDFNHWPQKKFQMLVDNIKDVGVLQPVIVRRVKGDSLKYEMLAGEHRWKAAIEAGLTTIPAKIVRECTDKLARDIFTMSNLLTRNNSIRDYINGWWMYLEATRYKTAAQIKEMNDEGVLPINVAQSDLSKRQIQRYANLHKLLPKYIDLLETQELSLRVAEPLTPLTEQQQEDLYPYLKYVTTVDIARKVVALASERGKWSKKELESLLIHNPAPENKASIGYVGKTAKAIIKSRLRPEFYSEIDTIMEESLSWYLKEHPEKALEQKKNKKNKKE